MSPLYITVLYLMLTSLLLSQHEAAGPEPLTYLEQKRREAQAHYREEQAYIAKNKDEFERLLLEDQKAMASEGPGSLLEALSMMQGGKEAAEKAANADAEKPAAASGGART